MKIKISQVVVVLAFLFTLAPTVSASPFTFEFVLPNWTFSDNPGLFGANATVQVTVNNGASTHLNQSFMNSQIVSVFVDAAGTYSNVWTAADVRPEFTINPSVSFISTNAAGVPLLNLLPGPDARIVFSNANGTWQFGRNTGGGGGLTQTWLQNGPLFTGSATAFNFNNEGMAITGSLLTSVPEPASLGLLLVGVGALGLSRIKALR